jgi:hypothetical protein
MGICCLSSVPARVVEMLFMPLQRFDEDGVKGDKPFGADPVGGIPGQKQRMLDFWPILSRTGALQCLLYLFCVVEEPPRVGTMVPSRCHKGI